MMLWVLNWIIHQDGKKHVQNWLQFGATGANTSRLRGICAAPDIPRRAAYWSRMGTWCRCGDGWHGWPGTYHDLSLFVPDISSCFGENDYDPLVYIYNYIISAYWRLIDLISVCKWRWINTDGNVLTEGGWTSSCVWWRRYQGLDSYLQASRDISEITTKFARMVLLAKPYGC